MSRFDGIEVCVIVDELLELETENKRLRKCLENILMEPSCIAVGEFHTDIKQALKD